MGSSARADQAAPHDSDYDVHVWQWPSDLQHYDGDDGVQEPVDGFVADQLGLYKIRIRRKQGRHASREGNICGDAVCGFGSGCVEGEWDGSAADYTIRLAGVGSSKSAC